MPDFQISWERFWSLGLSSRRLHKMLLRLKPTFEFAQIFFFLAPLSIGCIESGEKTWNDLHWWEVGWKIINFPVHAKTVSTSWENVYWEKKPISTYLIGFHPFKLLASTCTFWSICLFNEGIPNPGKSADRGEKLWVFRVGSGTHFP